MENKQSVNKKCYEISSEKICQKRRKHEDICEIRMKKDIVINVVFPWL